MKQSRTMIPEDEDTRIALNVLARHQTIYNLYRDILIDMMVCEIEGWDKKEYLNQLKSVIEHFEKREGWRMTNLDEAIQRFEKLASDYEFNLDMHQRNVMKLSVNDIERMKRNAQENRQLAEWLKALKEIWNSGDCNDCLHQNNCTIRPKLGQLVRFNCYQYERR